MSETFDDLRSELKYLRSLDEKRSDPAAQNEIEKEWRGLDLRQVAINASEGRDPTQMGELERMLSTGDIAGLRARLGPEAAAELQDQYAKAWDTAYDLQTTPRSAPRAVADTAVDLGGGIVNGVLGIGNFIDSLPFRAYAALSDDPEFETAFAKGEAAAAKEIADINKFSIDSLRSDHRKAQEQITRALTAKDEQVHADEADAAAAEYRGEFLPVLGAWSARVAKDAGAGILNTVTNPTMLTAGAADAASSIMLAGGMTKTLSVAGQGMVRKETNKILQRELAKGAERTVAEKVAADGAAALAKRLERGAVGVSVGAQEAAPAYQQKLLEVLEKSPEDLERTSADYRAKVAELKEANPGLSDAAARDQARYWLAEKTASSGALLTGIFAAGVGHMLPDAVLRPFGVNSTAKTLYGGLAKDVAKEGVEETLQSGGGALIGGGVSQALVDPETDVLKGVGTSAGQGLILGAMSAGGMKAPGTVLGTGQLAANQVSRVAERRLAAAEASGKASVESLTEQANSIINSNQVQAVSQAVASALGDDAAAKTTVASVLDELVNSAAVYELPGSHGGLSEAHRSEFVPEQSRVQAVDRAAKLLLAESDPAEKAKLALFLSDLMEPVRRFRETPAELDALTGNAAAMESIEPYRQVLAGIERLPSVKKASAEMVSVLEGQQSPEMIAALATVDPGLGGKVSARQVEKIVAMADTFTPTQQAALKGSLALLRAREAASKSKVSGKLVERHLGGKTRGQVSEEVTVAQDAMALEDGKYSARQHADRVIRAMMSGRTDLAAEYLLDLGLFAQHQVHKVQALNRSLTDGKPKAYRQLIVDPKTGKRGWANSATNPNQKYREVWVEPKSQESVTHAQEVDAEANLLYELHKGLTEAYPQLGVKPIQQERLAKSVRRTEPAQAKETPEPKKADPKPEAPPKAEKKNEVRQPKNEVKAEPKAEAAPEKPKTALQRLRESLPKKLRDRARILGTDSLTGLRSRAAWDETPLSPGSQVLIVTSAAAKAVNDHEKGGHDTTNELLRVMGVAVSRIDGKAARSGTNFLMELKPGQDPDQILAEIRKSLPDQKFELVTGVGADTDAAFKALDANSDSMREKGILPARGETAVDLSNLDRMEFAPGLAEERLSQQTVDRVRKMDDDQFHREAFEDKMVPGVLNKNGWDAIPRKAWVASIDLKRLKEWNDRLGKPFGDAFIKKFSEVGRDIGGSDFDFAHLSGDEYAAQADSQEALEAWLAKLKQTLQDAGIPATYKGEEIEVYIDFRQGVAEKTYGAADRALNAAKRAEQAAAAKKDVAGRAAERHGEEPGGRAEDRGPDVHGPAEEVAPPKVGEAFPLLHEVPGKVRNFFKQVFSFGKKPSTRLVGKTGSLEIVREAALSDEALQAHMGEQSPSGTLTPSVMAAYQALLQAPADALEQARKLKEYFHKLNQKQLSQKDAKGKKVTPRRREVILPETPAEMRSAGGIAAFLQANLEEFLQGPYDKSGMTREQALREGKAEMTVWQLGKALNLVELDPATGKFRYNPELIQQAAMAGLQWQITASQRQAPPKEEEIAKQLGVRDVDSVPDELMARMASGESLLDAKQSLANHIRRFWGVQGDRTKPTGFTEAIPEAVAGELLRAMEQTGLLTVDEIRTAQHPALGLVEEMEINRLPGSEQVRLTDPKEFDRYLAVDLSESDEAMSRVYDYPDLLEEIVVVEPEATTFHTGDEVPVLKNQLGNPNVKASKQSNQARANMQRQEFKLHEPIVQAHIGLSPEKVVYLYGHELPASDEERAVKFNKNHLDTLEGQNFSLLGGHAELKRIYGQMGNRASRAGVSLWELGKKFQYALGKNNRSMMLGANNPQSNKYIREMLLPTKSTLDLSEGSAHRDYFLLAVSQALGEKVHKKTLEENAKWAQDAIDGKLVPAVGVLKSWLQTDRSQPLPVEAFREALVQAGVTPAPIVTMALMEVARTQLASPEQLRAFETPIYLEADGMTNGPFNALGLLTTGGFTLNWVESAQRGGLTFGKEPRTADALLKGAGSKDLYKAGMEATRKHVAALQKRLASDPKEKRVNQVANQLFDAMSILLEGEVKWIEDSREWDFERGLGKNPMTVLVYGSGIPGISGKIAYRMMKAFYEKASILARVSGVEGKPVREAYIQMFPKDPPEEAVQKGNKLLTFMNALTSDEVVHTWDGRYFVREGGGKLTNRLLAKNGAANFTFSADETKRLQANVRRLLVEPMQQGIEEVLGRSIFASRDLLVKASNFQATVARELYFQGIQKKIAEKVEALKASGLSETEAKRRVSSEFLSRQELDQVWDDLASVMPLVESDGQTFLIAKSSLLEFWSEEKNRKQALYQYSRSLDDHYRTAPYVSAIDRPGVSATPYVTIGMGDARMVRKVFEQAFEGALQVFDGINIPVNKIPEYGERINRAALEAWQGNIFRDVAATFERFAGDERVQEALKDPRVQAALEEAKLTATAAPGIIETLNESALQMQARQNVLAKYAISMDQMAGTYHPHVSEGLDMPEGATSEQVAQILDAEYQKELERLRNPKSEPEPKSESPGKQPLPETVFTKLKRRHSSGAWVFAKSVVARELPRLLKDQLTASERELLGEILRSGSLEDTRIVSGTREEVSRYQESKGLTSLARVTDKNPGKTVRGFYVPEESTIYLVDPSVESLVHELVHASTLRVVEAYYEGRGLGPNAEQVREAVQRLESLMDLFLKSDLGTENADLVRSVTDARSEIRGYLSGNPPTAFDRAAALNEFMSWTLTNRELAEELSKRTAEAAPESGSRLLRLVRAAYSAIKKLIWGRKTAPSFGSDVLSQIRFNTGVIAREATSLEARVRDGILAHAVLNGQDPEAPNRLAQVHEAFARKVARHLGQTYSPTWMKQFEPSETLVQEHANALSLSSTAQALFPMNQQERDVFELMVLTMGTQADINPHAMIEAQKVFSHFLDGLTHDDFLTDPENATQTERAEAIRKFEFLSGHSHPSTDPTGRSSLLPVFLALGTSSEAFRALLAKKQLQAKDKTGSGPDWLDSTIDRFGNEALDWMEGTLAGTDHPENVRVAIDQLTQGITKATLRSQTRLEQKLEDVDRFTFGLNAKASALLQQLGNKAGKKGDELRQSESQFNQKLGTVLKAVSFLSSDKNAAMLAESGQPLSLAELDKSPVVGGFFRELVVDMIGRVESQGEVYDMVKKVRAFVSQSRQKYRDNVPRLIDSMFKSYKPTKEHWDTLHRVMGRWDMASLLDGKTADQVLALASDPKAVKAEIDRLSSWLASEHPPQAARYQAKIDQLAKFIRTGERGSNLLRNAYAISELLGEKGEKESWAKTPDTVRTIDQLVTLKLLDGVSEQDRNYFAALLKAEPEGLKYTLNYLKGQRATELEKADQGMARFNHYKGSIPVDRSDAGHIVVASDEDHAKMLSLGYKWEGKYKGSTLESGGVSRSYYYSPDGGVRTTFSQGIAQNVQQTAFGVHLHTGFSTDLNAGLVTNPAVVRILAQKMAREAAGPETLSPVYGPDGEVIAFERSLDPEQTRRLERPQHLAKMIGHWRGRQQEEVYASEVNRELVDKLHAIWDEDLHGKAGTPGNQDRYVDLFDAESLDPVVRDAVSILPHELREHARRKFGGHFYVRRNMLNQAVGYREASVGDMWTGNTRWSPETQEAFKKAAITAFGLEAYRILVNLERNWMSVTASMRTNVVVRSLAVPFANFVSGIYQLRARGVPLLRSLREVPAKVAELEYYSKTMARRIELEAKRFAENDVTEARKIDAQLQALDDSLKRLSIWPLIEAGEFSTIADVGQVAEDLDVSPKTLVDRITAAVDKLPPGLRDAARQGYMARDTAIFQVLQKSVQYSDFIMKAIYYDHMRNSEKIGQRQALTRITEEFNNYDMPRGRTRGYLENMGLAWFLNYKIRAAKVGLSMLRNNPIDVLLFAVLPHPFHGGTPVTDNIFARLLDGTLISAFGPGMVFRPIALNPWYNLVVD